MKKTFINIGTGAVLADAVAAIIHGNYSTPESAEPNATLILKSGGHLPTTRTYGELVDEVADALEHSPLTEFVPEIAEAMTALQGRMSAPAETHPHSGASGEEGIAGGSVNA